MKAILLTTLALAPLLGTAQAVPPWNNQQRRTEVRQEVRVERQQNDKAVKPPLSETVESHYLMRNPDEREQYFSRRTIVTRPSKSTVPVRSSKDHDPDTGTYYYIPKTP